MDIEQYDSNDIDRLIAVCESGGKRRNLKVKTLGVVDRYPINVLYNDKKDHRSNLLIIGSIHGDEPSGSWGIAQFIDTGGQWLFDRVNLCLLPIVNPTALRDKTRKNMWGEDPNRQLVNVIDPSYEGKILLDNLSLLTRCAKDGFLSLHEDVDRNDFYLYCYHNDRGERIGKRLRDYARTLFSIADDKTIERAEAKDGIIYNHNDQSFENLLFTNGGRNGIAVEIPGKKKFATRVNAAAELIEQFIILSSNADVTFKEFVCGE